MITCICLGVGLVMHGHVREEIAIKHLRPSKLIASLNETQGLLQGAQLSFDDGGSKIIVEGTPAQVDAAETAIKLFDVARQSMQLRIKITSVVDKSSFETTVKLGNNQLWTTTDSDSDSTITLRPMIAADGKVQTQLVFETKGGSLQSQIRLVPSKATKLRGSSEWTIFELNLPFFGRFTTTTALPAPEVEITLLR